MTYLRMEGEHTQPLRQFL